MTRAGDADRPVIDRSAPFDIGDLFFSRTDERGVLLAGNDVFQSISQYCWSEMQGAPHKIIRHPDMPRAVFHLLWSTIQKGEPVGAYVKNRAKDGRYYWVFAIVSPIEGGYISVRLKPTSALFDTVRAEYAALREHELAARPDPADSAALLLARLRALGFPDYRSFMAVALATENEARARGVASETCARLARFDGVSEAATAITAEAHAVQEILGEVAIAPLNMRIQSARLGEAGRPISVIAQDFTAMADDVASGARELAEAAEAAAAAVREAWFLATAARVHAELAATFERAGGGDGVDQPVESRRLHQHSGRLVDSAEKALRGVASTSHRLREAATRIDRLMMAYTTARVMFQIETARIASGADGLDEAVLKLGAASAQVEARMRVARRAQQAIGAIA